MSNRGDHNLPRDDGIGAAVRRKEDFRFVTGQGSYTDDLNCPGQTYAAFVRSPNANAKLNSVNRSTATAMDCVVAIFTGQDLAGTKVHSLSCGWPVHSKDGEPSHPALAQGKVRHVGDSLTVVIAETVCKVHGGSAPGIGRAMLEGCVYGKAGQLVTGSHMDYDMPRADNLPNFTVDTQVTPCPHRPPSVKGCGEAGAIAVPAAVMNAVTGATRAAGVTKPFDMPAIPLKERAALHAS